MIQRPDLLPYPDLEAALAGYQPGAPDPRQILHGSAPPDMSGWRVDQPMAEPDPAYPAMGAGDPGYISPMRLAVAQSLVAHPIAPRGGSQWNQFLSHAASRGADVYGRSVMNEYENSPGNPGNRKSLAKYNTDNIKATLAKRKMEDTERRTGIMEKNSQSLISSRAMRKTGPLDEGMPDWLADKADVPHGTTYRQAAAKASLDRLSATLKGQEGVQLPPDVANFWAAVVNAGGTMPAWGRNPAGANIAVTRSAIAQKGASPEGAGTELVTSRVGTAGDAAAIKSLTQLKSSIDAYAASTKQHVQTVKDYLSRVPETGAKLSNLALRDLESYFGSQDVNTLRFALTDVNRQYNNLINNPNLKGQTALGDREKMDKLIDPNATVGQILDALAVADKFSGERSQGIGNEIAQRSASIRSRGSSSSAPVVKWGKDANGNPVRLP